jgi:translation initiation factor 5B
VAVSMDNVTIGRQLNEGDVLYVAVPEDDFRKLKAMRKLLSREEIELLKELADIMRKNNPTWGV